MYLAGARKNSTRVEGTSRSAVDQYYGSNRSSRHGHRRSSRRLSIVVIESCTMYREVQTAESEQKGKRSTVCRSPSPRPCRTDDDAGSCRVVGCPEVRQRALLRAAIQKAKDSLQSLQKSTHREGPAKLLQVKGERAFVAATRVRLRLR